MKRKLDVVRRAFAIGMAAFGFYAPSICANEPTEHFDPKINAWAEGSILSLDVDAGKFSIRGSKKPYATAYARMMQDIYEKTKNLAGEKRERTIADTRAAWQGKLDAASKEPTPKESDFTFNLPPKTSSVYVFHEESNYGKDLKKEVPAERPNSNLSENEAAALKTLKDFKVGESIVVGYESGLVYNTAYTIIRIDSAKGAAWTPTPAPGVDGNPAAPQGVNPADQETAKKIQKEIENDKTLSAAARNVTVLSQDGKVTLEGAVQSEEEKKSIEAKAAAIAGADHVKNNLKVAK
ncbi:MAG: BON domain-containing protein [Planctomycetes bacterium]|nr:BON domain-containing protein [Planctomycetota bacterium]